MAGTQGKLREFVEEKAGAWYNMYVVSLFIEGDCYEQGKNKSIRKTQPSIVVFLWTMAAITGV